MFADCHGPLGLAMTCGGGGRLLYSTSIVFGMERNGRCLARGETFLLLNCCETCLSVGYYLLNSHDDHMTCNRDRTRT